LSVVRSARTCRHSRLPPLLQKSEACRFRGRQIPGRSRANPTGRSSVHWPGHVRNSAATTPASQARSAGRGLGVPGSSPNKQNPHVLPPWFLRFLRCGREAGRATVPYFWVGTASNYSAGRQEATMCGHPFSFRLSCFLFLRFYSSSELLPAKYVKKKARHSLESSGGIQSIGGTVTARPRATAESTMKISSRASVSGARVMVQNSRIFLHQDW